MVEFCTRVKVYGAFNPVFEPKTPPSLLAFLFLFKVNLRSLKQRQERIVLAAGRDCVC